MHTHTHTHTHHIYSSKYVFFAHKLQQITTSLEALSVDVCRTPFFLLHLQSKLQQL